MHTIALQLAPVLGAEKSKVPFYIAGGLLVLWALFVSLGVGARRSDFPASSSQERGVLAVTGLLVLAAVASAVITSGGTTSSAAAGGAATQTSTPTGSGAAATSTSTQPASTTGASTATSATPTATTGTPAPASSPAAQASSLKLAADPGGQLSYDTKQLSAKAGSVKITFTNTSPLEHNVTIAQGASVLGSTPTFAGATKALSLTLKPGKYTFYCSVPGHRQAGMEGTLSVS
jgi:plastocyanin